MPEETSYHILLVDDDESLRRVIEYNLTKVGYQVTTAQSGEEGLRLFKAAPPDMLITDITMPGMSGIELLEKVREISNETVIIVITAYGTIETAVDAMRKGAADYVTKPFNRDEFAIIVRRALRYRELERQNRQLRDELRERYSFEGIIGVSRPLRETLEIAERIANSDAAVLITGESGTGKELLARGIHYHSGRSEGPFVAVNCAAIPENLLESELFGHVRGAFTGAVKDKPGKFELADGGTLFLDEVADLKVEHQVKLLRVLQDKKIDRVGGLSQASVDVRLIAATNRNVEEAIASGDFRDDLYYRLSVITLEMPPLRNRRDDIPLLVDHFIRKFNAGKKVEVAGDAMEALTRYGWPGNVRELENVIERALLLRKGDGITTAELTDKLVKKGERIGGLAFELPDEGFSLDDLERDLLVRALERHDWNQSKAARYLGLSRPTLIYRMEKYGIGR